MEYLFLKKDFDALLEKIQKIENDLVEIGKGIKQSCEESSETWHDNFDYEEAKRKQKLVVHSLNNLLEYKKFGIVVKDGEYTKENSIVIGKKVTLLDTNTLEEKKIFVSSFVIIKEEYKKEISYNSPLAQKMMGKIVGETFDFETPTKKSKYKIISII